ARYPIRGHAARALARYAHPAPSHGDRRPPRPIATAQPSRSARGHRRRSGPHLRGPPRIPHAKMPDHPLEAHCARGASESPPHPANQPHATATLTASATRDRTSLPYHIPPKYQRRDDRLVRCEGAPVPSRPLLNLHGNVGQHRQVAELLPVELGAAALAGLDGNDRAEMTGAEPPEVEIGQPVALCRD